LGNCNRAGGVVTPTAVRRPADAARKSSAGGACRRGGTPSDRPGSNAGLQPTTVASHTATVTAVAPCRHRRRHRSRWTSRSVMADRQRGGNPAATRSCVRVPQNFATVPGATPTSWQNRSSVTLGPTRPARSRSSVRKSLAGEFMGYSRRMVRREAAGSHPLRRSLRRLPYGEMLRGFLGASGALADAWKRSKTRPTRPWHTGARDPMVFVCHGGVSRANASQDGQSPVRGTRPWATATDVVNSNATVTTQRMMAPECSHLAPRDEPPG
jgi:hypothetical protein